MLNICKWWQNAEMDTIILHKPRWDIPEFDILRHETVAIYSLTCCKKPDDAPWPACQQQSFP